MAVVNANALIDLEDLKEYLDTDLTDPQLASCINMAYAATRLLTGRLNECGGNTTLAEIQKLLAAHFVTLQEPVIVSESIAGEASVTYSRQTGANLGAGLGSTPYGQSALALDCSGTLAQAGLKRATFKVWDHDDIDYDVDYEDVS